MSAMKIRKTTDCDRIARTISLSNKIALTPLNILDCIAQGIEFYELTTAAGEHAGVWLIEPVEPGVVSIHTSLLPPGYGSARIIRDEIKRVAAENKWHRLLAYCPHRQIELYARAAGFVYSHADTIGNHYVMEIPLCPQ